MNVAFKMDGLREWASNAKRIGDAEALEALRDVFDHMQSIAVQKARVAAAATGRHASVVAAESLRGAKLKDRAIVRAGGPKLPWVAGENFGSKHDLERTLPNGRRVLGWNQFPLTTQRANGGWIYKGVRAALVEGQAEAEQKLRALIEQI